MRILGGMYADAETGLYYWGARYYDPKTGRGIQPDGMSVAEHVQRWKANMGSSTRLPLEINPYVYTANNPLRWIDRTGFETTAPGTGTWPSGGDVWEGIKGGAAAAARQCAIIAGALLTAGISGSVPSCGPDNEGPPGCKPDDDHCEKQYEAEKAQCWKNYGATGYNWIVGACLDRASERFSACVRNVPGPPPWSDADVNGWRPPSPPGKH